MTPSVSVVIPTYNRRKLLFRALGSVFGQTHRPVEVIVVDDASSDGTVEALRRADFPVRVEVLALPFNQGPAAARNAGIRRASGRYVAFLDSDDVWLADKLERQTALLEASADPDRTLAYSRVWIQRKHEALVRPVRAKRSDEPVADYVFANGGYLDQNTIVIPTALARLVMYRPGMRLHEDWDFYLRLEEYAVEFLMSPMPLGITFDTGAERASAARPHVSLALLEEWRPKISPRAYHGLRARIAPQLRRQAPLRALRFITEAWSRGAIDTWFALALTGRLVHPELRTLAYFVRGRLSRAVPPRHS
jgi:glycosyltransferase involved in cell wall biosynthesis